MFSYLSALSPFEDGPFDRRKRLNLSRRSLNCFFFLFQDMDQVLLWRGLCNNSCTTKIDKFPQTTSSKRNLWKNKKKQNKTKNLTPLEVGNTSRSQKRRLRSPSPYANLHEEINQPRKRGYSQFNLILS